MNASTKRIAAIGSIIALVVVSGCASLDATVSVEDNGHGYGETSQGPDILRQMHADSQLGD